MTAPKVKLAEAQRAGASLLRAYWDAFCDSAPTPDDFLGQMEKIGLIRIRPVRKDDIKNDPFATEHGIEMGRMLWELTSAGRRALAESPDE